MSNKVSLVCRPSRTGGALSDETVSVFRGEVYLAIARRNRASGEESGSEGGTEACSMPPAPGRWRDADRRRRLFPQPRVRAPQLLDYIYRNLAYPLLPLAG